VTNPPRPGYGAQGPAAANPANATLVLENHPEKIG